MDKKKVYAVFSVMVVGLLAISGFVIYSGINVHPSISMFGTNHNSAILASNLHHYSKFPKASVTSSTYVLLVHGYNIENTTESDIWYQGVNMEQQIANAGYIVGVVSYYGEFTVNYSNGYKYTNNSFDGTIDTPIEQIAAALADAIYSISANENITLDIIAHSMGGLVVLYMLENYVFPNVNLQNFITLGTPFNGSYLAKIASFISIKYSGYQAEELSPGSAFLTELQTNVDNFTSAYPNTVFEVYIGTFDPWWGGHVFNSQNDGAVSYNSATYLGFSYVYEYPVLHCPTLDHLVEHGISYFEDQNIVNGILLNLSGTNY